MNTQIGLALSGGGARGFAHIGVLKVLEEAKIPVHLMTGTSMGGVIAAIYAAGHPAAEIEHIARSLRLLDIVQRDRTGLGLIGQGKIANRFREIMGGDPSFDQLRLPLALVASDLETGEEVVIREGSVIEAMLATMAVPILFPPVKRQTRLLVDGGLLNQVPFDVMRQMTDGGTPTRIIAVHILHGFSSRLIEPTARESRRGAESVLRLLIRRSLWAPMFEVAERSYAIIRSKQVEQLMLQEPPDLMIKITLDGIGLLDLDQVNVCVKAGEQAARQHMPELVKLRDTPPPSRLAHWWHKMTDRFTGKSQKAEE